MRIERLLQPQRELLQRVAVRGALVELGTFVTFAQRGEVGHRQSMPAAIASLEMLTGKALSKEPTV